MMEGEGEGEARDQRREQRGEVVNKVVRRFLSTSGAHRYSLTAAKTQYELIGEKEQRERWRRGVSQRKSSRLSTVRALVILNPRTQLRSFP